MLTMGSITKEDVVRIAKLSRLHLSDDEVEQLLNGLEDKHGNVNYEEFVRMLLKS